MPGGDRTGPRGEGSRTGRAAGYCSGNEAPGYMNRVPGYGGGRMRGGIYGRGGGRGRGFIHPRSDYSGDELENLRREADDLEQRLRSISSRIADLEAGSQKDSG